MTFPSTIFLLATILCTLCVASCSSHEADALITWKETLHTRNNIPMLPSWTQDSQKTVSPCNWYGVSCNEQGSISKLNLSSSGLYGTFDQFPFSSFPNLAYLDLGSNNFSGIIPSEIGKLSKLVYLDLSTNQLNGSIPKGLCQLRFLSNLALSVNNLYGSVPSCFGQLSNLNYLYLNSINISGLIPPELGNLFDLKSLYMVNNSLTGPIPKTFVNLKNLTFLVLSDNQLSGSIPEEIGHLTSLECIDLQDNNLNGRIPSSLGDLKLLNFLRLYRNKLSGPIPQELGSLISLTTLQLNNNRFNGSIPNSIGNLQYLKVLFLNDNELKGPIPQELGKLKLVIIELSNNGFSGSLPDEICNGTELVFLLAGNNSLTGQIPKSLYNCSSLNRVRLEGNQLTGDISESFGIYPYLDYISLNDNKLYGEISDNWSKCTSLTRLEMAGNRINGSIPPSLGQSSQLHVLNLSHNDLVGPIPSEFGRITSLVSLSLGNNRLSGLVPLDIGRLSELLTLDMSMNKLNGSIPSSIGDCSKLYNLNLSNNKFTHEIPARIGRLLHLSLLDLSHNSLSGGIPSALSSLNSLEMLNLSQNNLSGPIPKTFASMNALWTIDLSYNQLEGPIPNSRGFLNVSIEALQGNKDLCGNVSGFKPCASERHTSSNGTHKLALLITLPLLGALLLGGLVGTFAFFKWRAKKISLTQLADEEKTSPEFFSISTFDGKETYLEILNVTEEFSEAYCIGKGGCGSVYKASLASGDIVAVKRLHSSAEVTNGHDFLNEIRALTRIRHRNIVKLHGYCSHARISFLVYEYLEGGSLADILSNETAHYLDWSKRVNIIKGVAHALSYMHHDCSPPIVHRDISSKNILLDSEYEACVSDFGTSKILNKDSSNWSNVAGTYGYLAPEFAYTMKVTEKCDVYSFGVLVLEVINGEHPGDIVTSLTSSSMNKVELKDLLDHRLPVPLLEIKKVLTSILVLAIRCVNSNPEVRPTMYDVSRELASIPHV